MNFTMCVYLHFNFSYLPFSVVVLLYSIVHWSYICISDITGYLLRVITHQGVDMSSQRRSIKQACSQLQNP